MRLNTGSSRITLVWNTPVTGLPHDFAALTFGVAELSYDPLLLQCVEGMYIQVPFRYRRVACRPSRNGSPLCDGRPPGYG